MATAVAEVAAPQAADARPRAEVLRRADGVELLGEFADSGFKKPPLLARRADGQVIQLTKPLYAVAALADGRRDANAVAEILTRASNRHFTGAHVAAMAEKLRPVGVLALADGTTPPLRKREPVMALRHRTPLLPERAVNILVWPFVWLHWPLVRGLVVLALVTFDVWLFGIHGIAGGLRSALYNPSLLLAVLASVVVATAFHEFGHASACRYGGARPGAMGVGLYLVWPAFYCDVTDAYRLDRAGRLRTDLGGVYFNTIFALLAGAVFFVTGQEAALLAAVVQHVIALQQLLPLMRFDGYYVLTDLTGVPDILSRIKPIFRSLVRGRDAEPAVGELKPWVRVAVTTYLVILVPLLAFLFAWMVMAAPRVMATIHDSLGLQVDRLEAAAGPAEAGVGVASILMLVLPAAAMSLSLGRVTRMTGRGLVRWSRGSLPRTGAAVVAAAVVLGAVGYTWWPNGDYEPIRRGEHGTVGDALGSMLDAVGGRPFFTPEDALVYGSVATEREAEASLAAGGRDRQARPGDRAMRYDGRADGGFDRAEDSPRSIGETPSWGGGWDPDEWPESPEAGDESWPETTAGAPAPTTTDVSPESTYIAPTDTTSTTETVPTTTTETTTTDTTSTTTETTPTTTPEETTTTDTTSTTTETTPTTTPEETTTTDSTETTTTTSP